MKKNLVTNLSIILDKDTHQVEPTINSLKKECDLGLIINSSSTPKNIAKILNELDLEKSFVALNGAIAYYKGKPIYASYIKNYKIKALTELLTTQYDNLVMLLYNDESDIYIYSKDEDFNLNIYQETIKISNIDEALKEKDSILKIEIYNNIDNSTIPVLKNAYSLLATKLNNRYLITNYKVNKYNALKTLLLKQDIDEESLILLTNKVDDISLIKNISSSFNIEEKEINSMEKHTKFSIKSILDVKEFIEEYIPISKTNFTLYQLIKYQIELSECLEYTLITYKYVKEELQERINFLNEDYKKGYLKEIISTLFRNNKYLLKNLKKLLKKYPVNKIEYLNNSHLLIDRLEYLKLLNPSFKELTFLLDTLTSNNELFKEVDKSLIRLIEINTNRYYWFLLFTYMNMFVSTKAILMQNDSLYLLKDKDLEILKEQILDLYVYLVDIDLFKDIKEFLEKDFDEEEAYDILNRISLECSEYENGLYSTFNQFTNILEKDLQNHTN